MKKIFKKIIMALSLVVTLEASVTMNLVKAEAANNQLITTQDTKVKENANKEKVTKTVTTQKQLTSALKNSSVDTIIIKPAKATNFTITKGTYKKELVVYQAYTTLSNSGIFKSSKIIVTNQNQFNKAVKVKNIDQIYIKTTKKNEFTLSKGSKNIELVINVPNGNITNTVTWKNVIIENMKSSTWTEKASNNKITITGGLNLFVVDEKASIKSLAIKQYELKNPKISIKANGIVKATNIETTAKITLSGKNINKLIENAKNKTSKTLVVYNGNKEIKLKSELSVTPTPTEKINTNIPIPTPMANQDKQQTPESSKNSNGTQMPVEIEKSQPPISNENSEDIQTPEPAINPPSQNNATTPYVPAPPQTHSHTYSSITKEATCTEDGLKTFTCTKGDHTYTEVIPALGHTPGRWQVITEASYTTAGFKIRNCIRCDLTLDTEISHVRPHEHSYSREVISAATCKEEGVAKYTCTICGSTYTDILPVPGHSLGEWQVFKEASYTENGEKVRKCTVCGEIIESRVIPVISHSHDYTSVITIPATYESKGLKTYTCNICKDRYTEEIPMMENHTPATPYPHDIYTVEIDSRDGRTPTSVTGRDRLDLANEVFNKVNELRVSMGLSQLSWDNTLDDYTQLRAAEVTQKFSHERPNGQRGYQMNDKITSENIAVGYQSADEVMEAWKNSPSHYNAMINPNYDTIAVGCFEEVIFDAYGNPTSQYYTGWVQFFHDTDSGLYIEIEPHKHTYTATITSLASCTSEGVMTYSCNAGDHTYTEAIPAIGHVAGEWRVITEATVSNKGVRALECTICNELMDTEEIPALIDKEYVNGHELVKVTIDLGSGQTKEVKGYYDYDLAQEVYMKLNELRTEKGLSSLNWNNGMAPWADVRAAELTVKFDHYRPNGEYCYYIYDDMASENVAMGYTSASDVMTGWINSSSHYSAMVKADYKSVSISCFIYEAIPGQYIGYWSMLFSKK